MRACTSVEPAAEPRLRALASQPGAVFGIALRPAALAGEAAATAASGSAQDSTSAPRTTGRIQLSVRGHARVGADAQTAAQRSLRSPGRTRLARPQRPGHPARVAQLRLWPARR